MHISQSAETHESILHYSMTDAFNTIKFQELSKIFN